MSKEIRPFKLWRFSRFVCSLILAFIFLLSYSAIAIVIDVNFNNGRGSNVGLPVTWPRLVVLYLSMGQLSTEAYKVIVVVLLVGGNLLIYGCLVYSALTALSLLRQTRSAVVELPPAPTQSEKSG